MLLLLLPCSCLKDNFVFALWKLTLNSQKINCGQTIRAFLYWAGSARLLIHNKKVTSKKLRRKPRMRYPSSGPACYWGPAPHKQALSLDLWLNWNWSILQIGNLEFPHRRFFGNRAEQFVKARRAQLEVSLWHVCREVQFPLHSRWGLSCGGWGERMISRQVFFFLANL